MGMGMGEEPAMEQSGIEGLNDAFGNMVRRMLHVCLCMGISVHVDVCVFCLRDTWGIRGMSRREKGDRSRNMQGSQAACKGRNIPWHSTAHDIGCAGHERLRHVCGNGCRAVSSRGHVRQRKSIRWVPPVCEGVFPCMLVNGRLAAAAPCCGVVICRVGSCGLVWCHSIRCTPDYAKKCLMLPEG